MEYNFGFGVFYFLSFLSSFFWFYFLSHCLQWISSSVTYICIFYRNPFLLSAFARFFQLFFKRPSYCIFLPQCSLPPHCLAAVCFTTLAACFLLFSVLTPPSPSSQKLKFIFSLHVPFTTSFCGFWFITSLGFR